MILRTALYSTVLAGAMAFSGMAIAGGLPGFKQIGCWNKVVIGCEAAADIEARAACQHDGFATCNASHTEDRNVSLESIRKALPSVTATRIIVRQSANGAAPVASSLR